MSKKSGTAGGIISLPQGGGAMQGIGEKFSPDLHTGTGNFTIPLALPSGRNGFQPQLSLGYSTGNGNGPFGLGWGISVPGVSRQTFKGVPQYDDAEDIFGSPAISMMRVSDETIQHTTAGWKTSYSTGKNSESKEQQSHPTSSHYDWRRQIARLPVLSVNKHQ